MNDYQREQWDALELASDCLERLDDRERDTLMGEMQPYLQFRHSVDRFLGTHLHTYCTSSCYTNQRSACCAKDGIVTFWADLVINLSCSDRRAIDNLRQSLRAPAYEDKCTYLGPKGCRWQVRPLMCALFLCDAADTDIISADKKRADAWSDLKRRADGFRWPVGSVLFDRLELFFLERGHRSSLMYINTTPALMRVKQQAHKLAAHGGTDRQ